MAVPLEVVILTGAGISAESGLSTFRCQDGLWENHRFEDVATPEAFHRNPDLVQRFYNERRRHLLSQSVRPNAAHQAITELQRRLRSRLTLVTQNVDHLHEAAGYDKPWHMHGELLKSRCLECNQVTHCEEDLLPSSHCHACQSKGRLRPHVVWFGETPLFLDEIQIRLQRCDVFLSIGTSGTVYPAAGFVQIAKLSGAQTIEINPETTENNQHFEQSIRKTASQAVPTWIDSFLHQA